MRWPRLTLRQIMADVAVLTIGLGLGIPAIEVARGGHGHEHSWDLTAEDGAWLPVEPPPTGTVFGVRSYGSSFWDRYRRRLGLPATPCREARTHPGETCSFRSPP